MKVLKVLEGGLLEVKDIKGDLSSFQENVGGLIDVVQITDKIDLIVNDNFLSNGSEPTLYIHENLIIYGECLFTNYDDLTEEDINYLYKKMRRIKAGVLVWIENI